MSEDQLVKEGSSENQGKKKRIRRSNDKLTQDAETVQKYLANGVTLTVIKDILNFNNSKLRTTLFKDNVFLSVSTPNTTRVGIYSACESLNNVFNDGDYYEVRTYKSSEGKEGYIVYPITKEEIQALIN